MNKLLKSAITSALALGILMSVPISVNAKNNNIVKDEKQVVNNFLNALKSRDADTAVKLSRDLTMSYETQKSNLIDILNNPNTQVESFEILDSLNKVNEKSYLDVIVKYKNDSVEKVHIALEKKGNEYKISKKDSTVITLSEGTQLPIICPRTQLTSFSFNDGEWHYTNSFSYSASYVQVNFQAYGENTFRVVKTHTFTSDEEITYAASMGATSNAEVVTLNCKPGKRLDDVKLRIHANDGGNYVFGEVYAY